ncbi:MAG: DUF1223 domain-containing protein [Bdellovibrionia bacterium]
MASTKNSANENHIAVLELFTSQGCSSCPSADRLVATYSGRKNVAVLSFHVDYWDRLGWKDPYSNHDFTKRQYRYASLLNSSVFTPQLVIDGVSQMVGSDAGRIERALGKDDRSGITSSIAIQSSRVADGKVVINYSISAECADCVLNLALVEKNTVTNIKAGENNGATLTGTNVVRSFKVLNGIVRGENRTNITVPTGIENTNLAVVLYLQQANQRKIVAVTQGEVVTASAIAKSSRAVCCGR